MELCDLRVTLLVAASCAEKDCTRHTPTPTSMFAATSVRRVKYR
jgi:hypothetical protein